MAYVYILKSINHPKTYTGSTDRTPADRLEEHNKGYGVFSSRFKPWTLVYVEEYNTLAEARKREKYLKGASGRKFIKKNNIIRE